MLQKPSKKLVVVTGAAGYIGGMTCIQLKNKGYEVIGIDRRYNSHLDSFYDEFLQSDFAEYDALSLYKKVYPVAIIHCAGTSLVGPSFTDPYDYFNNNVSKTNTVLNFIVKNIPKTKFVFSSSASVYGNILKDCTEDSPTNPVSPYGESKLMVEKLLKCYNESANLNYVSYRYFNAAGADANGIHGQEPGATHIIARLYDAGLNDKTFNLYGTDYDTKDGTCIRDYIHVTDIADAHIIAIDKSIQGIYNLGSFDGHSNYEILNRVQTMLDKKIITTIADRRKGDPSRLIADSTKFKYMANWVPQYGMDDIITDSHTWYTSETYSGLSASSRFINSAAYA